MTQVSSGNPPDFRRPTLQTIFTRPTAQGLAFNYAGVTPAMISQRDLVHHMSRRECWGGNTDFSSYTVAQHALVVASACTLPGAKLYALLSNAPAGYLGWHDREFKLWLSDQGTDIMALERRIFTAILQHLAVPVPSSEILADVHQAEQRAEATERRDVLRGKSPTRSPVVRPLSTVIRFKPQPKVEEQLANALDRELMPFQKDLRHAG